MKASEGVLRTFVPIRDLHGRTLGHGRTTLALSWNGTAGLDLHEGRPPVQAGEVALDVGTLDEHDLHVGDQVLTPSTDVSSYTSTTVAGSGAAPQGPTATIVGAFSVAGGEAGVPGVALSAFDAGTLLAHATRRRGRFRPCRPDRRRGADPAALLTASPPRPSGMQVVPATQLGTREQLRAELEIQRAFFDLLSLDEPTRNAAVEGADQATPEARAPGNATFNRYLSQLVNVEFRVQRVSFLDADHASLVFMTYYGSSPSPVLTEPFAAHAVRVDGRWKVSSSTVCTLTLLGGAPCIPQPGRVVEPPPGWQLPAPSPTSSPRSAIRRCRPPPRPHHRHQRRAAGRRRPRGGLLHVTPPTPELETPYPLVARASARRGVEVDAPMPAGSPSAAPLNRVGLVSGGSRSELGAGPSAGVHDESAYRPVGPLSSTTKSLLASTVVRPKVAMAGDPRRCRPPRSRRPCPSRTRDSRYSHRGEEHSRRRSPSRRRSRPSPASPQQIDCVR